MKTLLLFTVLIALQWTYSTAELKCGKLDIEQLYNEKTVAALDEFPWFARIFYTDDNAEDGRSHRCSGVLISNRHVLTPAHCIRNSEPKLESVLLGDTYGSNANTASDCNDNVCAPPPVFYKIESTVMHPAFNATRRANDIAIIKLAEDVKLSSYVEPICLPDASLANERIPEYLAYAGFARKTAEDGKLDKFKTISHIVDKHTCIEYFKTHRVVIDDQYICGAYGNDFSFLSGAAIMGVKSVDNIPHSYYITGLLNAGTSRHVEPSRELFVSITKQLDWIKSVM